MTESRPPTIRVRDWEGQYENNRSREMKNTRWFPMPNDLSADSYVELLAHPDGPAHLGVWIGVLMVASRAKPRGSLTRAEGYPHDSESLARMIRQPALIVAAALERLLKIGVLETCVDKPPRRSALRSHSGASKSQDRVGKPQEGTVEGKGTEHHHQEGNRKEKKGSGENGTEPARAPLAPGQSDQASSADFSHQGDDGTTPEQIYASPEDELKAIFLKKAGEPITIAVLDAIRMSVESNSATMKEFVAEVKKSHIRGNWTNPPGFLRSLAKRFRSVARPTSDPLTAAEAAERNYQCAICHSRKRGEGAIYENGKAKPCVCASGEYVARLRERGFFPKAGAA